MRRQPLFALVVTITLGIGVGSAGAVFGIVNQLLLTPVPGVADPGGTAFMEFRSPAGRPVMLSWPDAEELRRSADLLEGLAGYRTAHILAGVEDARPVQAVGYYVYGDYFDVLGLRPRLGRLLSPAETDPLADPYAAVISERLWETMFGSDPDVIGRQFTADVRHSFTVVGVVDDFRGTDRFWPVDLWVPSSAMTVLDGYPEERLRSRKAFFLQFFQVRPRTDVGIGAAKAQVERILGSLAATHPDDRYEGVRTTLSRGLMHAQFKQFVVTVVGVLGVIVLFVLLIPCANVANLMLVRSAHRRGDLAVQRAMGASVTRIARQHVVESVLLATLGAAAGLGVAWLIGRSYRGQEPLRLPPLEGFVLDTRAGLFALIAIVVTTLLFGVVPAVLAGRFDIARHVRTSATRGSARQGRFRFTLSTAQIALSIPLLVGALLLGRTLRHIYALEPGIDVSDVYVSEIAVSGIRPTEEQFDAIQRELVESVRAVPGVEGAAVAHVGPYAQARPHAMVKVAGSADDPVDTHLRWGSPGWLELIHAELVSGRTFQPSDWTPSGPLKVVVTSTLAERLFGGTDVAGRTISFGLRDLVDGEIVGVLRETRMGDPRADPEPIVVASYAPPYLRGRVTVHVRSVPGSNQSLESARTALERAVPALAVPPLTPLVERAEVFFAEQRVLARLLGLLSGLAILVSAVGLYGVVAFGVANRAREFGIRVSLGATRRKIAALASASAASVVLVGSVLGLMGAYGVSRLIGSRLLGVQPLDILSYAGAIGLLGLVAALACWVPAFRAARLDPVAVLTAE